MPFLYQIPLLTSSNAKALRWSSVPNTTGSPTTVLDPSGSQLVPNPDSLGPPGWWKLSYDDSFWNPLVIVPDPAWSQSVIPGVGGAADVVAQGEPLWDGQELNRDATMVVRWRFTPPAAVAETAVFVQSLAAVQQLVPVLGYLNLETADDLGDVGFDLFGLDGLAAAVVGQPFRLGRIVPGVENLLCITVPYKNYYDYTSPPPAPAYPYERPITDFTLYVWWQFELVFVVSTQIVSGRSSVQFVG